MRYSWLDLVVGILAVAVLIPLVVKFIDAVRFVLQW